MTSQEWRRLQDLFEEVLQSPLAERQTALQQMESRLEDPALALELRRLVEHAEPDPAFLRPVASVFGSPETMGPSAFRPGEVVATRFEILRVLGRGGMGEVFEADDRTLGERVAIKVIAREYARDPQLLERFQREVQIARRITHPNICRIHDLGEHAGLPYLSMELLQGETLAARVKREPVLFEEWEQLARQLFDGLRAAHSSGVVHRDLKPSNLMLVGSRLVILDFGLARPILSEGADGLTRTGMLVGTLDWMAPEQLRGECDERSDLYSAALILLHALTGRRPNGDSPGLAGALRRATSDADFKELLPADLPGCWRAALLGCLERDPAQRLRSVREVEEVLAGQPNAWSKALAGWVRTRWMWWAAALAVFLALCGVEFRYLRHHGLKPGSTMVVATTVNATGESRFDGMTAVLRASLAQSSTFNVWDNQRMGEVLRSMRRDPQSRPDAKDWDEIAFREKAPLVVFSTLSRLGDGYLLAIRCEQIGGAPEPPVRSWDKAVRAAGPARLFEAVGEVATWVRAIAGEETAEISAKNRLPEDITSSSWEALELYSRAESLGSSGHTSEAIPVLQRAVQLDPQFAMGLMRLGDMLNEQHKEGFGFWRQAVAQAKVQPQRLSQHEGFSIESRYALEIGDYANGEPVLRDWVDQFPNDPLAARLLAWCLIDRGQYAEAIRIASKAQERFGPTSFGTWIVIRVLAAQNKTTEIASQIEVLEALPAHNLALRFRGIVAAMRDEYEAAASSFRELASLARGDEASRTVSLMAALEADQGRLDRAASLLSEGINTDREAGENGLASQKAAALAFLEGAMGHPKMARLWAWEAVSISPSPQVIIESVTVLARQGFKDDAARLIKRFPNQDGPIFEAGVLKMRGELLAARGDIPGACALLERAAHLESVVRSQEYLARVLDRAGQKERAAMLYKRIVETPLLVWDSPESELPALRFLAKNYLKKLKGI